MAKVEHIRELVEGPVSVEYLKERADAGWELVALEWQRTPVGGHTDGEEIPYGSRVANDRTHLEDDPAEMNTLTVILEQIVQDRSLSHMAEALNQQGFRTREGSHWTAVSVFNMLPRLIQVSPRIFSTEAWRARRKRIFSSGHSSAG
jgi:hypothetical protein